MDLDEKSIQQMQELIKNLKNGTVSQTSIKSGYDALSDEFFIELRFKVIKPTQLPLPPAE